MLIVKNTASDKKVQVMKNFLAGPRETHLGRMPVGHSPKDKNGENRSNPANPHAQGTGTNVNASLDVNVESMSMPMFRHSQRSRQGMHKGSAPKANSKPKL